jgi:hypothetical protein
MADLDDYKADHLFMLVGTNPLPNYVATRLLADRASRIYLLYSRDTEQQRQALERALRAQGYTQIIAMQPVKGSSAADIRNRITGVARGLKGTIGLHYTGGTKTMAVHSYRALERIERIQPVYYSYLDANTLNLWIEWADQADGPPIAVRSALQVSIAEILDLHDRSSLKQQMNTIVIWGAVVDALAEIHSDADEARQWREWCGRLKDQQARLLIETMPPQVCEALQREYPGHSFITVGDIAKASPFKQFHQGVIKWFQGGWLEQYVFRQLSPLKQAGAIHDLVMTINPRIATSDFEFDVGCTCGYQLFALSCATSDDPKRCKMKLLEAVVRAEQLGGSEARVALVCCVDRPNDLRGQVVELLGERRVRVFGRGDLCGLQALFKQWLDEAG